MHFTQWQWTVSKSINKFQLALKWMGHLWLNKKLNLNSHHTTFLMAWFPALAVSELETFDGFKGKAKDDNENQNYKSDYTLLQAGTIPLISEVRLQL